MLATGLYLPHDMVFLDRHRRAAAMWLPPGVRAHLPASLTQAWLVLRLVLHSGPSALSRIQQVQATMARHHPRAPHYYLHAIGARQDCQGMGLGSALLKQVTRRCDAESVPAYLESSTERNIPLYRRHGFEVTGTAPIGEGGPPLHFMWREPR
jgi:ribosomal protein S18 acetylase RimI-like enzyme